MNKITGVLIVLTQAVLYSSIFPLLKKANEKTLPFTTMAISMFVLFLLSLIASIVFENGLKFNFGIQKNSVALLILVGIINFIAFWLLILGFKYMPVWQQSMFGLLTPVLAGILAYFILGEVLSYRLIVGLVIMSIGLYIAVR